MKQVVFPFLLLYIFIINASANTLSLGNKKLFLEWKKTNIGWQITKLQYKLNGKKSIDFGKTKGEFSILYSKEKPDDTKSIIIIENGDTLVVLDKNYTQGNREKVSQRALSSVAMNQAGETINFYPSKAVKYDNSIIFESDIKYGKYSACYTLDDNYQNDILLTIKFTPSIDGYFSLSSPTLSTVSEKELSWAVIPGYFQGDFIQPELSSAYVYGHGLPKYPILCRESTITTLSSIITNRNGLSLGVIPNPEHGRNPYPYNENNHYSLWKVALSHMNNKAELSPTAYHPILGHEGSYVKKGETLTFSLRFSLENANWYSVYKHAIYDIYHLKKSLNLKQSNQSLSDRLISLFEYVRNDSISKWSVYDFDNHLKIGAQRYDGAVKGSANDALKNSDIAAAWMLAKATGDKKLQDERLPYMRNFKIAQQEPSNVFFKGAPRGQYYLHKTHTFKEEWGDYVEPIGLTYYNLLDIGNILLFNRNDHELLELFKLGAERLLAWQKSDGSFYVAYDMNTHKPIFKDLMDLRPTFYGLLVAYKILGDQRYLTAAEKGAEWFINNAVNKGHFLGVCGDYRFINDFATGQSAQVLFDLYEITHKKKYLDAAISVAKLYTTSIYTHPIPTTEKRVRGNKVWEDWQLSQVGLSFEHGGSMGSAVLHGPILLTSHAGMFVRMFAVTGDSLFLDLARAGALGRDAFLNPNNKVASYYWGGFDRGAGEFPHHAWWQIGWIVDYLMTEAEMRTNGKVRFTRGFCTPKVGAHQVIGFEHGYINSFPVDFIIRKDLVQIDNPNVDYIATQTLDKKKLFIIVLNNQDKECDVKLTINLQTIYSKNSSVETKYTTLQSFDVNIIDIPLSQ